VRAGDAAKDAQDGEVVADYNNAFSGSVARYDAGQTLPCSFGYINEPFAAGNLNLRRLGSPTPNEIRIGLFDFIEG